MISHHGSKITMLFFDVGEEISAKLTTTAPRVRSQALRVPRKRKEILLKVSINLRENKAFLLYLCIRKLEMLISLCSRGATDIRAII